MNDDYLIPLEGETAAQYKGRVSNIKTPHHIIRNSYGIYDAYKFYRKTRKFKYGKNDKFILTEGTYYKINRAVNEYISQSLVNGEIIILPYKMGRLEPRTFTCTNTIDINGNLIHKTCINWDKTLKLWFEDKESLKNKTLIYSEPGEYAYLVYSKYMCYFTNRSFYTFNIATDLKRRMIAAPKHKLFNVTENKNKNGYKLY